MVNDDMMQCYSKVFVVVATKSNGFFHCTFYTVS